MRFLHLCSVLLCCYVPVSLAEALSEQACLAAAIQSASDEVAVGALRSLCAKSADANSKDVKSGDANSGKKKAKPQDPRAYASADTTEAATQTLKPIEQRMVLEELTRENPFVITPHKPNFAVFSYTFDPNEAPYPELEDLDAHLQNTEIEFQLSVRYTLVDGLIKDKGRLGFAFTTHSFWQAFNKELSAPFRETNYEPELLLSFRNNWSFWGFKNVLNTVGLNHQSNGQPQGLSRSWNRITFSFVVEKGSYATSFKPWYRLPEESKSFEFDPKGDDNPDIQHYLGYFDWLHSYKNKRSTYSLNLRNNLSVNDNKATFNLTYSRALGGKLRVYAKYFHGYGRGMIDYDVFQQSLSIGFSLNDWI